MGNVWTERAIELAKICPRERFEPRALSALNTELQRHPANALTSGTYRAEATPRQIALACSGGSDSLALLLLTWGHFPEIKDRLCVLHLNHALRGSDSDGDAKFVAEVANALGADFVCEKVDWSELCSQALARKCVHLFPLERGSEHADCTSFSSSAISSVSGDDWNTRHRRIATGVEDSGQSLPDRSRLRVSEASLRKLRLEFYSRAMRSKGCEILLQGHQLSDVEELLIMRLTRGAGVGGLSAPRPISPQSDGRIFVRPLLNIPKHEIESFLKKLGIPWREDSTNAERDYFRCRIRHDVMPSLSATAPFVNIARSRMLLEETDDFLETCAEKFLQSEKKITPNIPRALLRRVLIKIFAQKGTELRAKTLDTLVSAICVQTPLKFVANENLDVTWDGNELTISASSARISTCSQVRTSLPHREGKSHPVCLSLAGNKQRGDGDDWNTTKHRLGTTSASFPHRPPMRESRTDCTNFSSSAISSGEGETMPLGCGAVPHSLSLPKGGDHDASLASASQKHLGEDSGQTISQEVVEITPELFEKIRAGEFSPDTTAFLAGTPEISIRRWEEGDAFRPLGSPGTKTLGNLFSDKKIPKNRRHEIPVCVDAKGIAWVPGLPPAERFRVSCGMKALQLTCKQSSASEAGIWTQA